MKIRDLIISIAVSAVVVVLIKFFVLPQMAGQEATNNIPESIFTPGKANVRFVDSEYEYTTAQSDATGWFTNGQDADIVLSSFGFDNSGGPLIFNHPGNMATDGRRLLLADMRNNRVLIWNGLPTGNTEPDIVLGQADFISNNPGLAADKLNWPVGVATDGERVIVADTENNRVLIWNEFPTRSGEPADIVLGEPDMTTRADESAGIQRTKKDILWPWAVWTYGERLIVTSPPHGSVLIWNTFPTENYQEADIMLTANEMFGTPRAIGSDGTNLVIGDHNAKVNNAGGNFFWNEFPTVDDQPYDFFMSDPDDPRHLMWGLQFTEDGKFVALGDRLHVWNSYPVDENDEPDLKVGKIHVSAGYKFLGGDGSGIAIAGGRMYISLSNGNKVVVYNSLPTGNQIPDFAIGASDINANTLEENYLITNPVPASDGEHLFVTSDFEGRMYVWKHLPDESSAKPDIVYEQLDCAPWDNALYGNTFVIAGKDKIQIWTSLPLNGEPSEMTLGPTMGNVRLQEIRGVALDEKYLYVADGDKVYVWIGIPSRSKDPDYTISVGKPLTRMSSDGEHLAINGEHEVYIYSVDGIPRGEEPIILMNTESYWLNLAEGIFVDGEHLFVGDTGSNRVLIWNTIPTQDNQLPDVVLGQKDFHDKTSRIGEDKLFMPAGISFDGQYLWVGEFKFSGRILRFDVS